MSYKTFKRRDQRRRSAYRIQWWKNYRTFSSDQAFEEWKAIHVDKIRNEYLSAVDTDIS